MATTHNWDSSKAAQHKAMKLLLLLLLLLLLRNLHSRNKTKTPKHTHTRGVSMHSPAMDLQSFLYCAFQAWNLQCAQWDWNSRNLLLRNVTEIRGICSYCSWTAVCWNSSTTIKDGEDSISTNFCFAHDSLDFFSFVFSAPLLAWRNLFSVHWELLTPLWNVPASQPVTISKKWKNPSSALGRRRTCVYRPFRDFRPVPLVYRPFRDFRPVPLAYSVRPFSCTEKSTSYTT
jgi:hypothetical protein